MTKTRNRTWDLELALVPAAKVQDSSVANGKGVAKTCPDRGLAHRQKPPYSDTGRGWAMFQSLAFWKRWCRSQPSGAVL